MHHKPTDLPLVPVFRAAAGAIRSNGHSQGAFYSMNGPRPPAESAVCAVGALSLVTSGDPVPSLDTLSFGLLPRALYLLDEEVYAGRVWPSHDVVERIADWNDADDSTARSVAETFLRIAFEIEQEHAHNTIVPTGIVTGDGTPWQLAGMDGGMPSYVLAGTPTDGAFRAGLAELVDAHGTVSARSAA